MKLGAFLTGGSLLAAALCALAGVWVSAAVCVVCAAANAMAMTANIIARRNR